MPILSSLAKTALGGAIKGQSRGKGLLKFGAGLVATRIATRSIPGALIVGGAFAAKKLYDARKAARHPEAKDVIIEQE